MPVERKQKNLYLSVTALAALSARAEQTGLNESRIVEQLLDPSPSTTQVIANAEHVGEVISDLRDRMEHVEATFDALAASNPALAKVWQP